MPSHFLENAHDLVISNSCFVDNSQIHHNSSGLQVLLDASTPSAAHDSSARYPPPRCHPETRKEYIQEVISWGRNNDTTPSHPLLWLNGPAGVGKSAIAQTCADLLGKTLGAAFFFSRPNFRDDPNRFFTTIAYQLATRHKPYHQLLDNLIREDPTLVNKTIHQQFQYLIVTPLHQLTAEGKGIERKVVIIDGIDECNGNDFQRDIINIIAASAQYRTTPFLWAFIGRPEPHLIAAFTSPSISHLCNFIEITVARDHDDELRLYLLDGLRDIQHTRGLPASWFSEEDLLKLVELAAGLFVYAATVLRFISHPSPRGPEGQLHAVLALQKRYLLGTLPHFESRHPLSELDLFYTLIMEQIPEEILPVTMKILLATVYFPRYHDLPSVVKISHTLELSESQFQNALCQNLQSVLVLNELKSKGGTSEVVIRFYHASFMEFLQDSSRSGRFCISNIAPSLRKDIFLRLNNGDGGKRQCQPSTTFHDDWDARTMDPETCRDAFRCLLRLCISFPIKDDILTLENLCDFNYSLPCSQGQWYGINVSLLRKNIPKSHRNKIIRPFWPVTQLRHVLLRKSSQLYTLGNGNGRVLIQIQEDNWGSMFRPLPRTIAQKWECLLHG